MLTLPDLVLRYAEPYSRTEREAYREVVYAGTLLSMQVRLFSSVLLSFIETKLTVAQISLPTHLEGSATFIAHYAPDETVEERTGNFNSAVRDAIRKMWEEENTQRVVAMSAKFQLNDSAR